MGGIDFMVSGASRVSVRLALAVAVLAGLVGAGSALGAMGTATPLTTTSLPDLRSVTLTGDASARFCFDKPIVSSPNQGGFYLGGYRADAFLASNSATPSGNCVNATFPSNMNLVQHSFAQVAEGAARAAGSFGNRADSTALIGSVSKNGTRGLTTGPDLTGVAIVSTSQIAYTFDQNVDPSAILASGGFHFYTQNATDVPSVAASISTTDPKTVIATFPIGGGTPLTTEAVRAYVTAGTVDEGPNPGAIQSQTSEHTAGTWDSAPMPSTAPVGATQSPDLVSAQYTRIPAGTLGVPGCDTSTDPCVVVDYVYDKAVFITDTGATGATMRSNYYAYLSDGVFVHPTSISQTAAGSFVVRAYYEEAGKFDEYLVKAAVTPGAASLTASLAGPNNTVGSAPIGGNPGAFASGYSTAPDALRVSFDTATNTAAVLFDQRVTEGSAADYVLLGPNGNRIASAITVSACPPGAPGYPCNVDPGDIPGEVDLLAEPPPSPDQFVVYVAFAGGPATVAAGNSLELVGWLGAPEIGPFGDLGETAAAVGGGRETDNVQQIVAPASVASHLHASRVVSHRRLTRAYLRGVLAMEQRLFRFNLKHGKYRHHRHL